MVSMVTAISHSASSNDSGMQPRVRSHVQLSVSVARTAYAVATSTSSNTLVTATIGLLLSAVLRTKAGEKSMPVSAAMNRPLPPMSCERRMTTRPSSRHRSHMN